MNNEDKKDRRKYERFPFREDIQIDGYKNVYEYGYKRNWSLYFRNAIL